MAVFGFFALGISQFTMAQSTVTTYTNVFDGTAIDTTWKPEHVGEDPEVFTLSQADGALTVVVDKNTGIDAGLGAYGFSALSLDLSNTELLDLTTNPIVRIRLKASAGFTFNVGIAEADSLNNKVSINADVIGDDVYRTYSFDFTGLLDGQYLANQIDKVFFNFNPGWSAAGKYAGTVTFDFLKIGDAAAPLPQVTSITENFDGTTVSPFWVPEHAGEDPEVFTLSQADGALTVVVDKNTGIDGGLGVYGFSALVLDMSTTQAINLAGNPLIKVRLKATEPFNLGVGPVQSENGGNNISQTVAVLGDSIYHTYVFDFTDQFGTQYDSTQIDKVYFNFNPGWAAAGKYAGTVTFDFLKMGDAAAELPQITTYVDNFDGTTVSPFWVPEHAGDDPEVFTLSQADGALTVVVDKNTGIDAGLGVYGFSALVLDMSTTQAINLAENPLIQISLKASAAFNLGVGPVQSENGGNNISQTVAVPGDDAYHTYLFDFTDQFGTNYDSTKIDKVYFNFNPGWAAAGKYAGTVTFDFLKMGSAAVVLSNEKAITAFSFTSPAVTGVIDEESKTIAVTVPAETDVTALVATFTASASATVEVGTTEQVSGTTANDFTSAVSYTVTAEDLTTETYVVTVTKEAVLSSEKAITAFSFTSPAATGVIDEENKTIAVTVPAETDVTALVATFAASASATVEVGTTEQVSGTTANDFTSPVSYTVTAEDLTTETYVVTVTVDHGNSISNISNIELTLYPNPASDVLKINTSSNVSRVELYDLSGRKLISQSGAMISEINVSSLHGGYYFVKVTMQNGSSITKRFEKR